MQKISNSKSDGSYYAGRVKSLSKFEPKPEVPSLDSFEEILQKIQFLMSLVDDFYSTVASSEDLVELVFKTPELLDKLFKTNGGPLRIISLLSLYPSYHVYVFQNSDLTQQFSCSNEYWASSFIHLIYSKAEIFNGLLGSEGMMRALARCIKPESHDHLTLCDYLSEKYQVTQSCVESVKNLKTPAIERELQKKEREEAVYNLLRSLQTVACTESCDYN